MKYLHLPIEQAVYVPSTSCPKGVCRRIKKREMSKRVAQVRKYLSSKYGGYTSVSGTGGYVMQSGKLVKEPVVRVCSFSTRADYVKARNKMDRQVIQWAKKWVQESVGYEKEGDMWFVKARQRGD